MVFAGRKSYTAGRRDLLSALRARVARGGSHHRGGRSPDRGRLRPSASATARAARRRPAAARRDRRRHGQPAARDGDRPGARVHGHLPLGVPLLLRRPPAADVQHRAIIDALRDHDAPQAEERMREHVSWSRRLALQNIRGRAARGPTAPDVVGS
jgi:hypothetical protein